MIHPLITTIVIAFGMLVAAVGVIAYLRMYKNSTWAAAGGSRRTARPSDPVEENVTDSTKSDSI